MHRALILAGDQWREAGTFSVDSALLWSLASPSWRNTAGLACRKQTNQKTSVKSQRNLQHRQNFLIPASQTTSPVLCWCSGTDCDRSDFLTFFHKHTTCSISKTNGWKWLRGKQYKSRFVQMIQKLLTLSVILPLYSYFKKALNA